MNTVFILSSDDMSGFEGIYSTKKAAFSKASEIVSDIDGIRFRSVDFRFALDPVATAKSGYEQYKPIGEEVLRQEGDSSEYPRIWIIREYEVK